MTPTSADVEQTFHYNITLNGLVSLQYQNGTKESQRCKEKWQETRRICRMCSRRSTTYNIWRAITRRYLRVSWNCWNRSRQLRKTRRRGWMQTLQKGCYDSAHICPIRAEISTYEHWENAFILLFVWLVVMGFRQNYFHTCISPHFGDFWVKMSFFSLYNQPKTENIKKKTLFPSCSKTPLISEMCIYITNNLCKWGLGTRGEQCSSD